MARNPTAKDPAQSENSFSPKSSFIENAAYNQADQKLTLTFKTGSQYVYQNVPASTWLNFQQSPDHSSFYANAIKKTMQGSPVKSAAIGQPHSNPLQKVRRERSLDTHGHIERDGIAGIQKRAGLEGRGTVPDILYSR